MPYKTANMTPKAASRARATSRAAARTRSQYASKGNVSEAGVGNIPMAIGKLAVSAVRRLSGSSKPASRGMKPSGSSSYPRSNVRVTTAPPTRPRAAASAAAPKASSIKPSAAARPQTSAKAAERSKASKPSKDRRVMVTSSTAKFDARTGEVVWTKQKPVPLKISKPPKPTKPASKKKK